MNKKIKLVLLAFAIGFISVIIINTPTMSLTTSLKISEEFWIAIGCELFVTIHNSVFFLMPISKLINANKSTKIFCTLAGIRIVILIIGDFINPMVTMMIDFFSVFLGAFIIVPVATGIKLGITKGKLTFKEYPEVSTSLLYNFGIPERHMIENLLIERFVTILKAYSEYDLDTLNLYCDNAEYVNFKERLKLLEQSSWREKFEDISIVDCKIFKAQRTSKYQELSLIIVAEYYNYTIDYNNKVINGSQNKKKKDIYELIFVREQESIDPHMKYCSNCGAPLNTSQMTKCNYCGTPLTGEIKDWVLNKCSKR